MEPVICVNCCDFFQPSPRHKNQTYCMKPECRRAKKAAWKRTKMRTDAKFRQDQRLSNQKWAQNNRDYWTSIEGAIRIKPIEIAYFKGSETSAGLRAGQTAPDGIQP